MGMIQSDSRIFLASLKSYLDKQVDVFNDKDILEHMNGEVPLLVNMINSVKEFENTIYLSDPLVDLFNAILKLYMTVKKLSFERFVKAEDFLDGEPKLECYPSLPLHSKKKLLCKAEIHKAKEDEDDCNKAYQKAPRMTPGLAHIFCRHGVCKGFTAMTTAENPGIFLKFVLRRLLASVKSERRVFL